MWSPDWPCSSGRVLFDRHSGDFWVVEDTAADLVRAFEGAPCMPWPRALHLAGDGGAPLLAGLVRAGILRAWNNAGLPVRVSDLADVD